MTSSADALREAVAARDWYHTLELNGVVTPGWFDTRPVAPSLSIPSDLTGKRCLDVGTFDGFWAFEMEGRGADEVHAIDVLDPQRWDWPATSPQSVRDEISSRHDGGGGFEIAKQALGASATRHDLSVYELHPDVLGMFDVVYVGSLLIHLRDPIGALEAVRSVCRGNLVLVDAIDVGLTLRHPRRPVAELDGRDRPWWWRANQSAIVRMVESAGFRLLQPPQRLAMPAGAGQQRAPWRWSTVRHRESRQSLLRTSVGDPHVAIVARRI